MASEDARGNRHSVVFDAAGRVEATVSPLGFRTSQVFDAAGRTVVSVDALGFRHSVIYMATGNPEAAIDPLGYRTSTVFDSVGRAIARVDALGRRVSWLFDAANQPIAQQDPRGHLTSTVYDQDGRPIARVDANGGRVTTLYDQRGAPIGSQDPLGAWTTHVFDENGNPVRRTDARNRVTTYGFDALDREATRLYRDGGRVTHAFDSAGQLTAREDAIGRWEYGYDLAGRKIAELAPTGQRLSLAVDAAGNRTRLESQDGVTSYLWDSQNRLVEIHNPLAERTTVAWDALDREQKKTLANGMVVSHQYDPMGREHLREARRADGLGLAVFTAGYDAVGNRLYQAELDGVRVSYGYDPSDQLVNEQRSGASAYNRTYSYDGPGNRLVKNDSGALTSYLYNTANELLVVQPPAGQPTSMAWDANGNLASENAGGQVTDYTWDDENRLLTAAAPGGTEQYRYDTTGLRRRKEAGGAVSLFLWDEQNLLLETDASLVLQARFTDFPGYWGGLASQRRSGASSFYGFDLQESTRILVSVGGAITDNYAFKAFGEELAGSGTTVNPHRYVGALGYYRDLAERLYVRARHLASGPARWLSRDPLRPGIDHPYLYAYNQPVMRMDPSGLQAPHGGRDRCLIVGVLGFRSSGTPVRQVVARMQARGFTGMIFESSPLGILPYVNTKATYDVMWKAVYSAMPDYPCICIIAYSWGAGNGAHLAQNITRAYPNRPLVAAATVDAIKTTPAEQDTEHGALVTRYAGSWWHRHYYAEKPFGFGGWFSVGGASMPNADFDKMLPGTDHISIQRDPAIVPAVTQDFLDRCYHCYHG